MKYSAKLSSAYRFGLAGLLQLLILMGSLSRHLCTRNAAAAAGGEAYQFAIIPLTVE